MPDPNNRADLPASWLPEATQVTPKPSGYVRAVSRKVREARRLKVLAMATLAEDRLRDAFQPAEHLEKFSTRQWVELAHAAGHPSRGVSAETRALVVEKVARDMAEPYRAKGRY